MQCGKVKIETHLPGIISRKHFFSGYLDKFCKIKMCIISNVDYCPGSKKSKFDMTLLSASPFNPRIDFL